MVTHTYVWNRDYPLHAHKQATLSQARNELTTSKIGKKVRQVADARQNIVDEKAVISSTSSHTAEERLLNYDVSEIDMHVQIFGLIFTRKKGLTLAECKSHNCKTSS